MARINDINEYTDLYLAQLLEMYAKTDPKFGSSGEICKHDFAQLSIEIFWYLHGKLLVWAQAHMTGFSILAENPNLVSFLEKKLGEEINEDSHILEQLGLQYVMNPPDEQDQDYNQVYEWLFEFDEDMAKRDLDELQGGGILTTTAFRGMVVELLMSRSADNSYWRMDLQRSLLALNEGEVDRISKPKKGKRQGLPYSLNRWKLEAMRQVRYRVGRGLKKFRALEEVGQGIGQSPETLRDWEKQLEKNYDHAIDLYCSELAGIHYEDFKKTDFEKLNRYEYESHRNVPHLVRARSLLSAIEDRSLEQIMEKISEYRQKKTGG